MSSSSLCLRILLASSVFTAACCWLLRVGGRWVACRQLFSWTRAPCFSLPTWMEHPPLYPQHLERTRCCQVPGTGQGAAGDASGASSVVLNQLSQAWSPETISCSFRCFQLWFPPVWFLYSFDAICYFSFWNPTLYICWWLSLVSHTIIPVGGFLSFCELGAREGVPCQPDPHSNHTLNKHCFALCGCILN